MNNGAVQDGGAIFNLAASSIHNCTFYGNYAARSGGAWFNYAGNGTLVHCTVYNNVADSDSNGVGEGGGLCAGGGNLGTFSSLIAGNINRTRTSHDVFGVINTNWSFFQVFTGGTFVTNPGTPDIFGVDPKLGTFGNHGGPTPTVDLLPDSPAIDKGSLADYNDQRGHERPQGKAADMGAFEFDTPVAPNAVDNAPPVVNPIVDNGAAAPDAGNNPPADNGAVAPVGGDKVAANNNPAGAVANNNAAAAPDENPAKETPELIPATTGCGAGAGPAGLAGMMAGLCWMMVGANGRKR